jgi:hypothetical protein
LYYRRVLLVFWQSNRVVCCIVTPWSTYEELLWKDWIKSRILITEKIEGAYDKKERIHMDCRIQNPTNDRTWSNVAENWRVQSNFLVDAVFRSSFHIIFIFWQQHGRNCWQPSQVMACHLRIRTQDLSRGADSLHSSSRQTPDLRESLVQTTDTLHLILKLRMHRSIDQTTAGPNIQNRSLLPDGFEMIEAWLKQTSNLPSFRDLIETVRVSIRLQNRATAK